MLFSMERVTIDSWLGNVSNRRLEVWLTVGVVCVNFVGVERCNQKPQNQKQHTQWTLHQMPSPTMVGSIDSWLVNVSNRRLEVVVELGGSAQ